MAKEILIVDSDKMVQEEFERIFEATDHHLFFTTNEDEALLRGKLFKPDIIIGGKDMCQAVRTDQELKSIPFIILLDMFEELSEKELKFLGADGMISKPFNEDEILSMVSDLSEEVREGSGEMTISEDDLKWKSFADIGKPGTEKRAGLFLDGPGETGEEIIELIDVVEEPESKMSIDDFALRQKEDLFEEIAPMEFWEKQEREEIGLEKEFILPMEAKRVEIKETSMRIEEEPGEEKAPTEYELFEKLEPEEILQEVERLQPSIEKEWPAKMEQKIPDAAMFDQFEATLRGEVKIETAEEAFQPFFIEETKQKAPELMTLKKTPAELEPQELANEEFLGGLTEELEKLEEEELIPEETAVKTEAETIFEEEITELLGKEIQPWEQALEKVVRVEEHPPVQELVPVEEIAPIEELAPVEELKEVEVAAPEVKEIPRISLEEIPPPVMRIDRKIEEVIARGIQEMMQDFTTKIIPEVAEHMIALTLERIETMVKEIVPDLAEKAIQEEIKRLQKGEKD